MNNNLRIKFSLKFFLYSFVLITTLSAFISCENFLQGEDVKEEITKSIEYNNAPSYTINVEALKGTGTVKTPATGEVTKKVTDVFPIRFEPEDSCKFIKWEAVVKDLEKGETPSDYIQFENAESLETKVTFKKASSSVIIIRPVCPPRLTYTFEQDGGIIYPKDSSIEFDFEQLLAPGCLAETDGSEVKASDFITIQELTGGVDASTYFSAPEVNKKKIIFHADTSFGYLPLINNQRMISVRIPKEKVWYINEQYTTIEKVYLDSDITKTFIVGPETSKKTKINYRVRQNGEENLGILKIDGDPLDNKDHEYSVGQKITLRYQLPDKYSFIDWKFMDSDGNLFTDENLKLTYTKEAESDNLQVLNIIVDNYMEKVVTVTPEICAPVSIKIVKGTVGIDNYKVDKTTITQEEQNIECGVGKAFTFSYKVSEGYYFHDWEFKRSYIDDDGTPKEAIVKKDELEQYGLQISYDEDADEKGYDSGTRIAQATILINEYTDEKISITPVCFENLKITNFNLSDTDKTYNRDSNIVFNFNKPISTICKENFVVRIPGLSEDKSWKDYFDEPIITDDTVTINAKNNDISTLIPLGVDGTNTITILFNAVNIYYETQTSTEDRVAVCLASDSVYTYKIDSTTTKKVSLKFDTDTNYPSVGTLKVSPEKQNDNYSMGDTIQVSFTLSKESRKSYSFKNWKMLYEYKDNEGLHEDVLNISDLDDVNLEFFPGIISETSEAVVYGATINVLNSNGGSITVIPELTIIPPVPIEITSGEHGISTAGVDNNYKLGEINTVEFKSDPDYSFVRWQLVNKNNNTEVEKDEDGNYIYIKSLTLDENNTPTFYKEKISFKIINIPDDDVSLAMIPVVAERPQVISNTPLNTGLVNIDTTIKVMFDYDMDEHSIYYTDVELEQLRNKLDLPEDDDGEADSENQLLYSVISGEKKYYGYRKGDKRNTVYKNISIFNNKLTENNNIIQFYSAPVFENPRTLSLSVKKEGSKEIDGETVAFPEIPEYTQIQINLDKNFFYAYDGVPVTMSGSKKWIYQVNNHTDINPPELTTPIFKINNVDFERESNISGINNGVITFTELKRYQPDTFNLELSITDQENGASGPASSFTLECTKVYDANYKKVPDDSNIIKNIGIEYDVANEHNATYNGNCIELQNQLDSGIYSIRVIVSDNGGNVAKYPPEDDSNPEEKWYLCLDKTGPSVSTYSPSDMSTEGTIKLSWYKANATDYDHTSILYQYNTSGNEYIDADTIENITGDSYTLTGLKEGTKYRFWMRYYDKFNNVTSIGYYYCSTLPGKPKDVSVSNTFGTTPTITASKPDEGNCSSIRVKYREKTAANNSSWTTYSSIYPSTTGTGSLQLSSGLAKGKTYEFEICSYDSSSSKYSKPYVDANGNLPSYTTIPAAVTLTNLNYNNTKNSLRLEYTVPSSDYTAIKLIRSTNSSFTNPVVTTITKANATGVYTYSGLDSGTRYYVKAESYFINENNKATSVLKSAYTMPDGVSLNTYTNTYSDEWDNNWISVDLRGRPTTGVYTGVDVYYKLSSDSSYKKANSNPISSGTRYYYIGADYDGNTLIPGRTYNLKVVTYITDTENSNAVVTNDAAVTASSITMLPEAVSNMVAKKQNDTSMNLTWTAPGGYIDGYNIYYSTSSSRPSSPQISGLSSSTTSRSISGLSSKAYYYIWIETYAGGSYSSTARKSSYVSSRCSLALDSVSNFSITAVSSTEVKLEWTNLTDSNAYDGLEIYRKKDGEAESQYTKIYTPAKTATSYSNTGLEPNVLYNYKIVTYKGSGTTRLTAETSYNRRTYSSSVSNFSATVQSPNSVLLSWTNPNAANYYQIRIYNGSTLVTTLSKGSTSYTVTGLNGATSYTFYVRTTNNTGYLSNEYPSGLTRMTNTATVTDLKVSNRDASSITLTWSKPNGNVTGYWARYKLNSSSSWTTLGYYTDATLTKTGLSAGTKYDFDVQAYYIDNGSYKWSEFSHITTSTYGAKLTSFAVSGQYSNSLYFTWTNLNSANYDYVRIWYKKTSASSWSYVDITKGNTGYSLSADSGCRYMVQAIAYFNGYGTYTDVIYTQTYPTTPTNFKVTSTEGVVTVSWTPPSGEQSYRLGYKKSGGSWTYVNIAAGYSSYSFGTEINNSSEYSFYMWSKMDYSGYGSTLTSVNTSTLTYFTPPPRLPGLNVGAGTSSWVLTIYNWDSVKSMIPYVNVFVDGVYQSGVFNSTTGKITLSGSNWDDKTITVVPYHCYNSSHGKESLATEYIYNGGSPQYKTLTTWTDETYGKRFSIYRLDVANYR